MQMIKHKRHFRIALVAMGIAACAFGAQTASAAGNPMRYFRAEDAVSYSNCVHSITNMQQGGELYGMTWDRNADYYMSRVLKSGLTDGMSVMDFLCTNVLDNAPRPTVAGFPGCTAFMATNSVGEHLVGRNCDYPLPMAHVLLFVPRNEKLNRKYSSIGTVDGGWVGYDVGQLDDGKTDLSYAAIFPYYCMDGMNEKGVTISILAVDARKRQGAGQADWMIEQFHANRTNIVLSVAIRYLLDNAATAEEAVEMLQDFNVFAAIGGGLGLVSNYHLYICDKSGDARAAEWVPPDDEGGSWHFEEVKDVQAISNFCMVDGYGHGSNRWEIARHALACQQGHLEDDDAMNLCRAASQRKNAAMTSWTHWSIVYNLDALSANIATLGNYDEIFPYWFKTGNDGWETGAAKSARPQVRTDLPEFPDNANKAESGKVYLLKDPIESATGKATEKPSYDGASVAAVNRQGFTYDAASETLHVVATNAFGSTCRAVFYIDMSSRKPQKATELIVAGVNAKGLAGRVVKFRNSTGTGEISPSKLLTTVLGNCGTFSVALEMMGKREQSAGGSGFILSDAMGNVAVWGPEGAELETDDASEMVRNSRDLRNGIYENDGEGRGEFDELPGLMRLASTANTRSVVSMGYGHLDVFLPNETNVAWRVAVPDADLTAYGVIAEPTVVPHATATLTRADTGTPTLRNNRGQLVAETDVRQKVTYTTEKDYYFSDGSVVWQKTFDVSKAVTIVPVSPTPVYQPAPTLKLGVVAQRYPWNGMADLSYKTAFWPEGKKGAVEVTVGETVTTNEFDIVGRGIVTGTAAVDLKAAAGEFKGEARFKAVVK